MVDLHYHGMSEISSLKLTLQHLKTKTFGVKIDDIVDVLEKMTEILDRLDKRGSGVTLTRATVEDTTKFHEVPTWANLASDTPAIGEWGAPAIGEWGNC